MLIEMGIELTVQLAVGLVKAIPELIKALPQIIVAIVNGLGDAFSALWNVGKDMVRGIWEGIKSMASWIWEKVKGFFSGIVDGVKDFLGIHSPSTVFEGIGDNMGLGVGVGFKKAMLGVKADMEKAIPTQFDINARHNPLGAAENEARFGGTVINQQLSVVTPKALSERELSREFKLMSRKLALGI
jgi:phage-related protein